jgi:hypothetical protein
MFPFKYKAYMDVMVHFHFQNKAHFVCITSIHEDTRYGERDSKQNIFVHFHRHKFYHAFLPNVIWQPIQEISFNIYS